MLAAAIAILVFACASLPGCAALSGRIDLPRLAAAGFAGQAMTMLVTALVSRLVPDGIAAWSVIPVALALTLGVRCARGKDANLQVAIEPWALTVPLLAGAVSLAIACTAMPVSGGGGEFHAWYNADFFKHLGHVNAIANLGLPARDIFGDGRPLAYYWLIYLVPGAGAALGGQALPALLAVIVIQTVAFWLVVHGLLRTTGVGARAAVVIAGLGWAGLSFHGLATLILTDFDIARSALASNVEHVGDMFVNGSTLFRLNLYIPQHQFVLAGLLGWVLLTSDERSGQVLRVVAHLPLVAAGAVSTLFGAVVLATFALIAMIDSRRPIRVRILSICATGIAAAAVPVFLGVIALSAGHGALASPIFVDPPSALSPAVRVMLAIAGLPLILGALILPGFAGLVRANLRAEPMAQVAAVLIAVGVAAILASTLLFDNVSLAREIQFRASLLPAVGLMLGTGLLVCRGLSPGMAVRSGLLCIAGVATPVLDASWHMQSTARWVTIVPRDDARILAVLARRAPVEALVLQYPASPLLGSGGPDIWVPIFAGRIVPASERATDWAAAAPRLERARAVFTQVDAPIPAEIDWVYLSRTLHSASFDRLMMRLQADPAWRRDACLPDACLFRRLRPRAAGA